MLGPNGFPLLYYHTYALIPKDDRDVTDCANYCPISLLNKNLKIFSKILANRLIYFVPKLVHYDQVGFITTREARADTNRALNLFHSARSRKTPTLLTSADAKKVFDRVNCLFYEIHIAVP